MRIILRVVKEEKKKVALEHNSTSVKKSVTGNLVSPSSSFS